MMAQVQGIVFLATPHRGSAHTTALKSLISVMVGIPHKVYVSELDPSSTSIRRMNEEFQFICGPLRLASVYETLLTRISPGIERLVRNLL